MWETEQFSIIVFFLLWKSMVPQNSLLQTFFKISSFVFGRTKKFIQLWNYLRMSKWWQNFHFSVNYPFKTLMYHHELQGLIWVWLFFSLKAWVPVTAIIWLIDCNGLSKKIFVCVLLKEQNHPHPGCPGGKQIVMFWENYPFKKVSKLSLRASDQNKL